MAGRVVFFVQSGTFEPAFQASSLAVTAAAMGDEVHVILAFDALRAVLEGRFGRPGPGEHERAEWAAAEALGVPSPQKMLEEARALGARLLACDTTVRLCGFDPERPDGPVRQRLDEVTGLASLWRLTEGARVLTL